jgi:hypothetical protein
LVDLLQSYAIIEQEESQMQKHGAFDMSRRIHSFAKARIGCTPRQFINSCVPGRMRKNFSQEEVRQAMDQLVSMKLGEWRDDGKGEVFIAIGKFPD